MSKTVVSATAFIGAAELIEELGGDPEDIAVEAGLTPAIYDDPGTVVGGEAFVDFLELASRRTRCSDFGLRHALRWPAAALGPLWLSVRSAETVREAIWDYISHFGVFSDAAAFSIEDVGGDCVVRFEPLVHGRWGAAQWIDASFGYICNLVRNHSGKSWVPPLVHLRHAPVATELFARTFGPRLKKEQDEDMMLLDGKALDTPILGGNREAQAMLRPALAQTRILSPNATRTRAQGVARMLLPHAPCTVDLVASALGMSRRTLQRHLAATGTNFRELLDEARASLALRYVTASNLRFHAVAEILGFKDQATFTRAFRRWYGTTPRAARKAASA